MTNEGQTWLLRTALALTGLVIVFLGVNVALGGMRTLGLQGPTDFFVVSDALAFQNQDNHVRFLGGVWLAAGLVMLTGALLLNKLRGPLVAITVMVFIGGLARLSIMDQDVLLSVAIAPSLFAELVLFPLLGIWLLRSQPNAR